MPVNRDTSFVDRLPQNVAVLFWDRVAESQTTRRSAIRAGRRGSR